jgi:hypothetical protein
MGAIINSPEKPKSETKSNPSNWDAGSNVMETKYKIKNQTKT